MGDFDFEELDKAVANVLGGGTPAVQPAARDRRQAIGDVADDTPDDSGKEAAGAKSAQAQSPDTSVVVVSSKPAAKPEPPIIVTPRASISRSVAVSTPASRPVIDIMAPPSKRPSRESTAVVPAVSPAESESGGSPEKDETTVDSTAAAEESPDKATSSTVADSALRWPPKLSAAPDDVNVATTVRQPSAPAVPKRTTPGGAPDESLARFDALSRDAFNVPEPSVASSVSMDDNRPTEPSPVAAVDGADGAKAVDEKAVTPSSPFLSDAKVEKRPLGSFSGDNPVTPREADASRQEPVVTKAPPAQDLPPADGATEAIALDHRLEDGKDDKAGEAHAAAVTAASPFGPSQPASMQLSEMAGSEVDDQPRPVFDTNEYHAPIEAQKAHKHNNGVLIISVVVLVAALAVGVGIYFYGAELGL